MGTKRGTENHEVRAIVTSVFSVGSGHNVPELWCSYLRGEPLQHDTAFRDYDGSWRERNTQSQALLQEVKNAKCLCRSVPQGGGWGCRYEIIRGMNSDLSLLSLEPPLRLPTAASPVPMPWSWAHVHIVEQRCLTTSLERNSHANKQDWQEGGMGS